MGIRFQCPNGHKLHVKTQLAGQHGFCPECNARVQIPAPAPQAASTPDNAAAEEQPGEAHPQADTQPGQPAFDPESSVRGESILAPQPEVPKARPKAIPKARPVRPASPPANSAPAEAAAPEQPSPPPAPAPTPPPTADAPPPPPTPAPQAQWHLQTATGEQLGPATAAEVVGWQTAGLLIDEAHIWRTGWPEWRTVGAARAELPTAAPGDFPSLQKQPPAEEAKPESVASRYVEKRRRAAKRQVYVAVLLLVLVIGMGVAMAIVLNRPTQPDDPLPAATPAPPAEEVAPPPEQPSPAEADDVDADELEDDGAMPGDPIMDDAMDGEMSQ